MTINKLCAGAAGALVVVLAGSVAIAAQTAGAYRCQTWNSSKSGPAATHCMTWTREAAARMRAAKCAPAMMADAAMRAQCLAMANSHPGDAAPSAAAS
jgi:hypothetical protein